MTLDIATKYSDVEARKNQLFNIKSELENTLNYSLSLSNLELYHSNLFAFVIQKTKFVNH